MKLLLKLLACIVWLQFGTGNTTVSTGALVLLVLCSFVFGAQQLSPLYDQVRMVLRGWSLWTQLLQGALYCISTALALTVNTIFSPGDLALLLSLELNGSVLLKLRSEWWCGGGIYGRDYCRVHCIVFQLHLH